LLAHEARIAEAQHHRDNPVLRVMDALKKYILEFESQLNEQQEIGVRLISFGGEIVFHAQRIAFMPPNIITFYGVTTEGERVQLIQHVSQLNILLKALPKMKEKATRIGFNAHEA
jgi:hypothetical protein